MRKNVLLTIAYDGSGFHGWQRQPSEITVQGHLETVMSRLFKTDIILNGTSRTDAGVHAYGQRASFKADLGIPTERIPMAVNNALVGAQKGAFAISPVRILKAEDMPDEFHARFDSKGKQYIYRIRNSEHINVFDRNYVYHVRERLDVDAMIAGARALTGTHDFKSFEASGGNPRETTVRTIYGAEIKVDESVDPIGHRGRDVKLYIKGDGFLYNMVRIITGTLVDMGLGRISPDEMTDIITAADRRCAGHTAPPYGLYLAEVFYDISKLQV